MVDYGVFLYGSEGQIERKKEEMRTLQKHYKDMRHSPQLARGELCIVRVCDYDRYYFEDYAAKNLGKAFSSWLASKGGTLGWLLSIPIRILCYCFGFKGYPKRDRFPKKKYRQHPTTEVVSFMLGRHEDDYFNLIPHVRKPRGMIKHPNKFVWDWRRAKGIAWLYGLVEPIDNPSPKEMAKVNAEHKRQWGRNKCKKIKRI